MSTKNLKIETKWTLSDNEDYSDPTWEYEPLVEELDPTTAELRTNLSVGTSAETLYLTNVYSAVSAFRLKNKDATNYLIFTYTSLSGTACTLWVNPGAELALSDIDPSVNPTMAANGAAILVDILLSGET
jgi:hypothetical protein